MRTLRNSKFLLMSLALLLLGGLQVSCSKEKAAETEKPIEDLQKQEAAKEAPPPEPKRVTHDTKSGAKETQQEAHDSAHKEGSDDKKVTNVKEAFQYTGKEMDKGFKKTGKSIKKAFVGD